MGKSRFAELSDSPLTSPQRISCCWFHELNKIWGQAPLPGMIPPRQRGTAEGPQIAFGHKEPIRGRAGNMWAPGPFYSSTRFLLRCSDRYSVGTLFIGRVQQKYRFWLWLMWERRIHLVIADGRACPLSGRHHNTSSVEGRGPFKKNVTQHVSSLFCFLCDILWSSPHTAETHFSVQQ